MRKTIFSLIVLLILSFPGHAQQFPILDNYLVNPVSIAPAFSGKYYTFQAIATHRSQSTGITGAPVIGNVNIDGRVRKNMGVGGSITLSKAGIYKNFSANLNYAYHVQLAKLHYLSFAVSAALYQNSMDVTSVIVNDPNDPMLLNHSKISESYFNVGTSILYNYADFNFAISFPLLFNNKSFYVEDPYANVLTMNRNFMIYTNYALRLAEEWQLKFDLLFRYTQQVPWTIEVSSLVKFQDSYWFGVMYRKPTIIGLNAGLAIVNSVVINYTYEFQGSSMMGESSGTHEISLGYRFGGTPKPKKALQIKDYAR